jgi:NADH-ubiquinone oxidoreductase chain 2
MYYYINDNKEYKDLLDKNNSPIQLISQLRGYFYINPILSLSLIITIFSFVGIPPLIGFFAKQMVLSAALDKGYFFLSIIAILTSVIGAAYYLNIIKEIYFYLPQYKINPLLKDLDFKGSFYNKQNKLIKTIKYQYKDLTINSIMAIIISILTLIILLFIFINKE